MDTMYSLQNANYGKDRRTFMVLSINFLKGTCSGEMRKPLYLYSIKMFQDSLM